MPKSSLSSDDLVPAEIDTTKTDVREVGIIEAQSYTARILPARPG
jgi:hypothetical protein